PCRMVAFIHKVDTYLSYHFPHLQVPNVETARLLILIHNNVPGIMAQINQVYADHNINIVGQFLMTNKQIGYAITDVSAQFDKEVLKALKQIDHTIKFRILY